MDDGGKNSIDFQCHCAMRNFIKVTKSECEKDEKLRSWSNYKLCISNFQTI